MSSFADSHSERTSSNQRASDQHFEVLDYLSNNENQQLMTSVQPAIIQHLLQKIYAEASIQTDQQQAKENKDKINKIYADTTGCEHCNFLALELTRIQMQKQALNQEIQLLTHKLIEQQKKHKIILENHQQNIPVSKLQMNYCVNSLKEIIECYDQEQKTIIQFIQNVIGISNKGGRPKNLRELVQAVFTQYLSNWQQMMMELQAIQTLSANKNKAWKQIQCDTSRYNHFVAMRKIGQIKDNIKNF